MPTLPRLKSDLDALAFRIQSLSQNERERLGREMDVIEAMVQLGRDDAQQLPSWPARPDELARLDRLVARVSARFEHLLSEPTRVADPRPTSASPAP